MRWWVPMPGLAVAMVRPGGRAMPSAWHWNRDRAGGGSGHGVESESWGGQRGGGVREGEGLERGRG